MAPCKEMSPMTSPSALNLPSTDYTQSRDFHRVFEMKLRALDCKIIFKMQKAKKL